MTKSSTPIYAINELARHKILDIADSTTNGPIIGAVTAQMTGHLDNIALLRQIRAGLKVQLRSARERKDSMHGHQRKLSQTLYGVRSYDCCPL
jgi:UDP-3-O-acyl-N-acetylglucosamine deacetylase